MQSPRLPGREAMRLGRPLPVYTAPDAQASLGGVRSLELSEVAVLSGLLGLAIFIADIWAIISVMNSGATTGTKVLWVLLILFLPLFGLIIWWFAGPKSAR